MPPSATPGTSSYLGQCVVCGKETSTKCSSCQKVGLNWMYFCSVEHQRLIWKIHKRVCGKNPFEWPPLNDSEAEDIFELRNEVCNTEKTKNLMEMMVDPDGRYSELDKASVFENMLEVSKLPPNSARLPAHFKAEAAELLAAIRGLVFNIKMHQVKSTGRAEKLISPKNTQKLLVDHPFDLMAYLMTVHTGSRTAVDHPCWRSDYLHRFLIFVAILAASLKFEAEHGPDASSSRFEDYLRHAALACSALNPTADLKLKGGDFDELVNMLVSFARDGIGGLTPEGQGKML